MNIWREWKQHCSLIRSADSLHPRPTMASTHDEIAAILRLKAESERFLRQNQEVLDRARDATAWITELASPALVRAVREQLAMSESIETQNAVARQFKELMEPRALKAMVGALAGVTESDVSTLSSGTRQLAEQIGLISSKLMFPGLKELLPPEALSSAIARSLGVPSDASRELFRTSELFKGLSLTQYKKEVQALRSWSEDANRLLGSLPVGGGYADLLNVTDVTRSLLGYETIRMSRAYTGLLAGLAIRPDWLASAPAFVESTPGEIAFAQATFVRTVSSHDESEDEGVVDETWASVQHRTSVYVDSVLPQLNPLLMKSWEGVWVAAHRRGPDWFRQAAASLRHLIVAVLDEVAPVNSIDQRTLPVHCINAGKVLRIGQVHWLCEPLKNRNYRKFVRADLESAVAIVDAMNEAIHRDESAELEEACEVMMVRAGLALSHLLQIWKARN